MGHIDDTGILGSVVRIIQISLTPVFLLSGIATLLNVFSTRLGRVSDRVDKVAQEIETASDEQAELLNRRLDHLHRRTVTLDVAVALGAAGGASTCFTVLALFLGEANSLAIGTMLLVTFGLAIGCTLAAIVAYAIEMLMASRRIRADVAVGQLSAERD